MPGKTEIELLPKMIFEEGYSKKLTRTQKAMLPSVNSFKSVVLNWLSQLGGAGVIGIWWVETSKMLSILQYMGQSPTTNNYPIGHHKMSSVSRWILALYYVDFLPIQWFSSWRKWLWVNFPGPSQTFLSLINSSGQHNVM